MSQRTEFALQKIVAQQMSRSGLYISYLWGKAGASLREEEIKSLDTQIEQQPKGMP